jgi:hypothetical protein
MSIKFKIEGQPYEITNFISIEDYVKIYKIKDFFTDQYLAAKLVNMISKAPLNDLLECPFEEIEYLASYIISLLPNKFNSEFKDQFEIDGVKYGFFPNWKDLTFAEFVDMDTISTKKPDEVLDLLHILAAVMFRPITEQKGEHNYKIESYDIASMKERSELFKKKLDIRIIIGGQFFFIKFANKFSKHSQSFSQMNLKMNLWDQLRLTWMMTRLMYKITSKKPTGGFWSSTKLLRTILLNTNTSTKRS